MKVAKVIDFETMLTFGKYAGETVEEILVVDPHYIKWCIDENILVFEDEKNMKVLALLVAGKDEFNGIYKSIYDFTKTDVRAWYKD